MKRVKCVGAAVVAVASLTMSACTAAPSSTPATSNKAPGNDRVTYLISQPDTPEQLTAIKQDIAAFEQKSGVTVKLNVIPLGNLRTVLQTQLRSGSGPDVFDYDPGPGSAGVLAKAGLLYDMTEQYAKQKYTIYDWAKAKVTFDGKILGIPDQIEEVGLYYNKDIFEQYGLAAPQSLTDLGTIADTLKAKGLIPITLSDKEGWEGGHLLSMSVTSRVGADEERALIDGDSDWSSADVAAAINTWKEFDDNGWLPKSAEAITYNNANALFFSGKAAMNPTGTWLVQDIATSMKANVGFVPFPGPSDAGVPVGDIGSGHFMSAKPQDPAAALAFMDYIASPDHGQWELSQAMIPAYPIDTTGLDVTPLFAEVIQSTASFAESSTGVGENIDVNSTDVFNNAMWDGMQGLLAGTRTPREVANRLQAATTKGAS